jgi:adenine phosphoribosyltransferase
MHARTGVARLALTADVPILPAVHWGTREVLDRYNHKFRPLPRKGVVVRCGPPVDLSAYRGRPIDAALLREVTTALAHRVPADVDVILTPEAMGIPVASGVALQTGKPLTVARKRAYGLDGEVVVEQRTGYGASRLHVHGIRAGDRVVIVDDVVSTGGTLRALVQACRQAKAHVRQILVVVNKDVDLSKMAAELGAPMDALVRLRVHDGRVVLED